MTSQLLFGFVFISVLLAALPSRAALVGYWNFNETSGTVAHNQVAGGPDGTLLGGASFAPAGGILTGKHPGDVNYALKLDHATNDLVDLGDNYRFASGPFTIVCWVKLAAGDTTPMYPIAKYTSGTSAGYFIESGASQVDIVALNRAWRSLLNRASLAFKHSPRQMMPVGTCSWGSMTQSSRKFVSKLTPPTGRACLVCRQ